MQGGMLKAYQQFRHVWRPLGRDGGETCLATERAVTIPMGAHDSQRAKLLM